MTWTRRKFSWGQCHLACARVSFTLSKLPRSRSRLFLIWHERQFPLTHDLAVLLRLCVSLDPGIATGVEPALDLTQFAARFRYPGEDEIPSLEEARQWVAAAAGVLDCVSIRIAGGHTAGDLAIGMLQFYRISTASIEIDPPSMPSIGKAISRPCRLVANT